MAPEPRDQPFCHPNCPSTPTGSGTLLRTLMLASLSVLGHQNLHAQTSSQAILAPQENTVTDQDIQSWIAKLGSDSYTQRTEALKRLESYGTRALDSLRLATRDSDPQIANQARFLLQSTQLQWNWNYDSIETRKIIEAYKLASVNDKPKHIRELAQLSNSHGIAALCRICCYDSDEIQSKLAALELLARLNPRKIPGVSANPKLGPKFDPLIVEALLDAPAENSTQQILTAVEGSTSQAAAWVRLAYSTSEPWPLDRWMAILDQEQKLLEASSPQSQVPVFVSLATWVAQQAILQTHSRDVANQIAGRLPPILLSGEPDPDWLVGFAQWAIDADLPELVLQQYLLLPKQFPQTVPPILNYLLAESLAKQGKQQVADQIVQFALDRKAIVLNKENLNEQTLTVQEAPSAIVPTENNPLQFRSINFKYERTNLAQLLINRGQFNWAESELRESLEGLEDSPDSIAVIGLQLLASMLHEQDRDEDAAKALEKWISRYESEKLFRMQVENYQIDLASNYYLFEGNHQAQKGNVQKAREAYFKSISLASDNVDALIGLARLSETPEEKRQRLAQQEQCQSSLRNEIDAIDRDMRLANPMFQPMEKRRLANSLNTLAWLMINTQTDPREALMLSRRSCSLVPDQSAYQDTLAHCLDKNGNPKEAFRTQIKALTLEPHQLSLQRALAGFYEKAAKEIDDQP